MKKLLLLTLSVAIGFGLYAQKRTPISKALKEVSFQGIIEQPLDGSEVFEEAVVVPIKASSLLEEEEIGETWYDLQGNKSVANRTYYFDDGAMAATWTRSIQSAGFSDRGTGYNYFDGNSWGPWPDERIETQKCGWPSYAPLGENGEIVVSHNAVDALIINRRDDKGTGVWEETILQGPVGYEKVTWPRVVTSGPYRNVVHIIAEIRNGYNGQDYAFAYWRSQDGGDTWDIEYQLFDELGTDYYTYIMPDSYVFAEPNAGVIAFAIAGKWHHDVILMKSTDDGDTWDKTVVWEHPYPFYDDNTIFTDTLWAPDPTVDIAIDESGKAHIVFGLCRIFHGEAGTTYNYWPYGEGIVYWNEDMDPFEHANPHWALNVWEGVLVEDVNYIGWGQDLDNSGSYELLAPEIMTYRTIGLQTMPSISINENNQIFVTWAGTTEGYDNTVYNYKHIWARASPDNGVTWGEFHDLNSGIIHIYDECILPLLTANSDDYIYLMYNLDADPGLALDDDHAYQQNREYFSTILKTDIVGVNDPVEFTPDNVSQNYPNPFNSTSMVMVELNRSTDLRMEVFNLMGQKVFETTAGKVNAGTHQLTINASKLNAGVYFYTVFAGEQKVSRKMIVE
ncbi:MAG: T9SS type A sorting domain-containing protein [Bacteroidales bacterium]|nr:T9SS type A sorting domain-containing protein [Bacteroidales bacterium]